MSSALSAKRTPDRSCAAQGFESRLKPRGRRHRLASLLAALCLLGSTITIVHDAWHWQPHVGEHSCVLCLYHGGQSETAQALPSLPLAIATHERPRASALHRITLPARRNPPIRGPPARSI